jgi:hypothetical protein
MGKSSGYLWQLWLILHMVLAAVPPILYWAHRRKWRTTLLGCMGVLTASAVLASWLGVIARHVGHAACARFVSEDINLATAILVFAASLSISDVRHLARRPKPP